MNKVKRILCKLLWAPIDLFQKAYWTLWRAVQKSSFLSCGKGVFLGRYSRFTPRLVIGDDVYIGEGCRFQASASTIRIGSHVMIALLVSIHGGTHQIHAVGSYMKEIGLEDKAPEDDQDVIIEDDVWIGTRAILLRGVRIGTGSVVGAGTLVTKDVPPYSIVTGRSEQIVRPRFSEEELQRHIAALRDRERKEAAK